MGNALFAGWTGKRLQGAFTRANHDLAIAERQGRDAAFWRNAAYIALLTGGNAPKPPTC